MVTLEAFKSVEGNFTKVKSEDYVDLETAVKVAKNLIAEDKQILYVSIDTYRKEGKNSISKFSFKRDGVMRACFSKEKSQEWMDILWEAITRKMHFNWTLSFKISIVADLFYENIFYYWQSLGDRSVTLDLEKVHGDRAEGLDDVLNVAEEMSEIVGKPIQQIILDTSKFEKRKGSFTAYMSEDAEGCVDVEL